MRRNLQRLMAKILIGTGIVGFLSGCAKGDAGSAKLTYIGDLTGDGIPDAKGTINEQPSFFGIEKTSVDKRVLFIGKPDGTYTTAVEVESADENNTKSTYYMDNKGTIYIWNGQNYIEQIKEK